MVGLIVFIAIGFLIACLLTGAVLGSVLAAFFCVPAFIFLISPLFVLDTENVWSYLYMLFYAGVLLLWFKYGSKYMPKRSKVSRKRLRRAKKLEKLRRIEEAEEWERDKRRRSEVEYE